MGNTKEKILDVALDMFSKYGYSGTNIRELSEKLGLSKAAMYKHFESKEELLNQLIDKTEKYYNERLKAVYKDSLVPSNCKELKDLSFKMIGFTINDETIIKVRKMLTIEQFRNDRLSNLSTIHSITMIEKSYAMLFEKMMENGSIKKDNPSELAFEFFAPVTLIIQLSDRDPSQKDDVINKIEKHIDRFINIYGIR